MSQVTESMILTGRKMLSGISKNNHGCQTMVGGGRGAFVFSRVEIVTWLWIVSALATLAVSEMHQNRFYTHGRYGKREESYARAAMPFFSGSRYGRSGTTSARGPKSVPKLLEVSPRVDRFFLGSRYGKRVPSNNNNNNNSDNIQQQQIEPSSRISSLRRFEEALGYLDRIQRADNVLQTNDNVNDENSNNETNNDKDNGEEIPIDIPNDDELEKFW